METNHNGPRCTKQWRGNKQDIYSISFFNVYYIILEKNNLAFVAFLSFKTNFSVYWARWYQGHYGQKCPHTTYTKLYDIVSKYSSSVNWVIYYIINLNCSCTAGIHQIGHRCVTDITARSYFRNYSISFELPWAKWVDSSRILWQKTAVKTNTATNST